MTNTKIFDDTISLIEQSQLSLVEILKKRSIEPRKVERKDFCIKCGIREVEIYSCYGNHCCLCWNEITETS